MSDRRNKIKGILYRAVILIAMVFFAGQLALPVIISTTKEANAQWAVIETESVPEIRSNILDKVWKAIKTAADVTYKNVLKTFVNNLAYNAAVQLATGEKGQKPLFPTNPEQLLVNAADVAAGDFMDELANDLLGSNSKCYGYSAMTCKNDQSCPPAILDCSGVKMTAGTKSACNDSLPAMQQCIAIGCRLYPAENRDTYNQLKEAGKLDDSGNTLLTEGAASCKNSFSLCQQTPEEKIQINILARSDLEQDKTLGTLQGGKCPVTSIIKNFENQTNDLTSKGVGGIFKDLSTKDRTQIYLTEIQKTLTPEASQVGAYFYTINKANEKGQQKAEGTAFAQSLAGMISNVTSKVTGAVKTPAPLVEGAVNSIFGTSLDLQQTYTGSLIADAIGTFTSTLSSKLMKKYFEGLVSEEVTQGSSSGGLFSKLLGGVNSGITAAKLLFSELKLVDYSVGGNIDIITNLSSCPDKDNPTVDTCVIDARFATAIQQQLTVREAVDAGLLDASRTFGYESDGREPEYYNGYPYRSLVILRKYRIIPVGWELAAKYMQKYAPGRYSLGVLLAEYDNEDSPFYRLIDPNWVLKSPQLYCAKEGAGPVVEFEQAIRSVDTNKDNNIDTKDAAVNAITRNTTYCADEQGCLAENDDGSCKKYGYCIEEEPLWKFNGSSCDPQNNSCMAFDDGSAYLTNTINFNGCNSDNAGCKWYCQEYDPATGWQCDNTAPTGQPADDKKISLTDDVLTCSATEEGCSEFISVNNTGANLIKNAGFEDYNTVANPTINTDGIRDQAGAFPESFDYWLPNNTLFALRAYAVNDSFEGLTAARLHNDGSAPAEDWISQEINAGYLTDNRTFTTSLVAKRADGYTNCNGNMDVISFNLKRFPGNPAVEFQGDMADVHVSDQWTRYAVTTTWPKNTAGWENADREKYITMIIRHADPSSTCDILIDNVQVEEGGLTNYKDYEKSPKTYLTKAPEYLNCTGNVFVDNPACSNYALYCSPNDVGCTQFTSLKTGNVVNGTITSPLSCDPNDPYSCDQCPAEFDGCQAFRELATDKVPYRPAVDPISFVPDSGQSCPAEAVGCEEYTNLEEVSLGGEGLEYYSQIRQCVLNTAADVGTYYTWEGSDEFGYQLKDYRLKISNSSTAPCTNMAPEDPYMANDWPNCIDDTTFVRNPSVTEQYPAATCLAVDVGVNPDCAEFFDTEGNNYYRLKSRVIYASPDCKVYRNSIDSASSCEAGLCNNNGSVCVNDSTCNELLYHLIPGQGKSCLAENNGCRAYKGNAGDNTRSIYFEDFEDGTDGSWAGSTYSNESVNVGGHSTLFTSGSFMMQAGSPADFPIPFEGGNYYNLSFWAKAGTVDTPVTFSLQMSDGPNTAIYDFPGTASVKAGEWNRYEVGPMYMDKDLFGFLILLISQPTNPVYFDNITVTEVVENIYEIKDSYTKCDGYENCQQYRDLKGVTQYLKSFSSLCDVSKIGCQMMIDTKNTTSPGTTQYPLSRREFIRGDIDGDGSLTIGDINYYNGWLILGTREAPNPIEKADVNGDSIIDYNFVTLIDCAAYGSGGSSGNLDFDYLFERIYCGGPAPSPEMVTGTLNGTIPADSMVFLVNDPQKSCLSSSKGCERMGQPDINSAGIVEKFTDIFLINNPDQYDDILCNFEEDSCKEYANLEGSKYYFKDPGAKTCEYKKVAGQNYFGWYKFETNSGTPDCDVTNGVCEHSDILSGLVCSTDNGNNDCILDPASPIGTEECVPNDKIVSQPVNDWTGICPIDQSGCIEFRDPETKIEGTADRCDVYVADGAGNNVDRLECDSYYYIADDVDKSSCNGLVNRPEGCRLFYDTTDNNLLYYSAFTGDGQAPVVSCDPTEPLCEKDSNTVLKVRQDRTCSQWLECSSTIIQTTDEGKTENLCQEVAICDKMDEATSHCVSWADYTNANQTFSTPAFADKIKNYTGMVLAGLDWGRRCENNPNQTCDLALCDDGVTQCYGTADCPVGNCNNGCADGATCSDPQIIEGKLPVVAMEEVGSVGFNGNLINMGDFGDSNYRLNDILTFRLTGGTDTPPLLADPIPLYLPISDFDTSWTARDLPGSTSEAFWTEAQSDGIVPSANANIDENNVLQVKTNTGGTSVQGNGVTYDLGTNVIRDQEYVISFKLKWNGEPTSFDRIRAEFGYKDTTGTEFEWQVFGPDIEPSSDWQEYILGPITSGNDDNGNELTYAEVNLNIIHMDADGSNVQPVEFYLDDVALKPVLQTTEEGGYLTRDCRLYPRDDSKYCTYTDENNTTYKGWYGYCLEYDPQDNRNCINWWPIDVLEGESAQLNSLPPLNYAGRRPLYMCLESSGSQVPVIDTTTVYSELDHSFVCPSELTVITRPASINLTGANYNIIPETAPGGYGFWVQSYGDCWCNTSGECSRWNNSMNIDNISRPSSGITEDDIDRIKVSWSGSGIWEQWTNNGVRSDGYFDFDSVNGSGYICNTSSSPLNCQFTGRVDRKVYTVAEYGLNPGDIAWRLYPTVSCSGGGYQCLWVQIIFDGVTKQLKMIRVAGEDATGEWDEGAYLHLTFQLNETCQNLVEVVNNNDIPKVWWSRLNQASSYVVPNLGYNYIKNFNPYGAVINPALTEPTTWPLLPVQQTTNPPNSTIAHAGSPYGCADGGGICADRICNWDNGNDCATETDVNNCITHRDPILGIDLNDGYCIGLGSYYCSNNRNKSCDTNTDCGIGNTCINAFGQVATLNDTSDGIILLKRLFASVYESYLWVHDHYTTGNTEDGWKDDYVNMPVCPYNAIAGRAVRPQYVAGLDDDYCGVPPTISVTASGYEGNNSQFINLGQEGGRVQFNISIRADDDQLPISRIEVDWNSLDGNTDPDTVIQGSYGNGTLNIDHVYQPVTGNTSTIYAPKFRVVDNWGWCSVPLVSSSSCPYASDCRHQIVDGTACEWFDPAINVKVGI